jgi:hypothetical protein
MDCVRRLGGELSCGPVRIAFPDAPRDRRIGFGQLLEYRNAIRWRQVSVTLSRGLPTCFASVHISPMLDSAVSGWQEDAKKPSMGKFARKIFR